MEQPADRETAIKKLAGLIKDIKVAMLTTAMEDGALRSRPMATQHAPFDGTLWFFTELGSPKADEVAGHRHVNVSFADPERQHYVSVSGAATLHLDPDKAKELWSPSHRAWFPRGLDDPNLGLLRVEVERAEYWDAPSSTMAHIVGFAKAMLTGHRYQPGDNAKVNLANM
jgi:general stress protein 26